jgi:hypothetical protein
MANNFNATRLLSVGSGTYLLNEQFQCGYVSELAGPGLCLGPAREKTVAHKEYIKYW